MNSFPRDFQSNLTGFGGDASKNRAQHRDDLRKTPVILVHGNAANSADATFGMLKMKAFLKAHGYQDCEIWAMDYLGENNTSVVLQNVHIDHIEAFRTFVDKVKAYLGVSRLDFIAHSLGCGMVNGYLRGLRSNEEWDHANHRFHVTGTFVNLAGAISGLGIGGIDEFRTGSAFERKSHEFSTTSGAIVADDTPFGSGNPAQQIAPSPAWKKSGPLDADSAPDSVRYVALIARDDFVDRQKPDTGFRQGAHLNKAFNLGPGIQGHEAIIKNQGVFDAFKEYMNQHPPSPPVEVQVDKASGNHPAPLTVTVAASPPGVLVDYVAERLTRSFQAGFIVKSVDDTHSGSVSSGQSIDLDDSGAWDMVFSVEGSPLLSRTYGVGVELPLLTILTDAGTPFQGNLDVKANTNKGTVYFSLDGTRWNTGAAVTITESSKVHFVAIDANGLASEVASRFYEKRQVPSETATLLEHFLAQRLDAQQFSALFIQFGSNVTVTLYLIDDRWVLNPETPDRSFRTPVVEPSVAAGEHTSPMTVALAAHHPSDPAPRIYYSLDGSIPTESSPYFSSSGLLSFASPGTHTLTYRARDTAGNWSDTGQRCYRMRLKESLPRIESDRPAGDYPGPFDVTLSASDATGEHLTVYYTLDGSDPSDEDNPARQSFVDRHVFTFSGNGNHAVYCHARNSAGREARQPFAWRIDDQSYPETGISPSLGGIYSNRVEVALSASVPCAWTKYTVDGSMPSETNGIEYAGPIPLERSAVLRFRSKGTDGQLEPVRRATFTITRDMQQMVFDSQEKRDGCVKAKPDGSEAIVGTSSKLAIGAGRDGKDCRAILTFDTSALPDNARITKAWLTLKPHSTRGDFWQGKRHIAVDVHRGHFGSSRCIGSDDWGFQATALECARIEQPVSATARSGDFSRSGLNAIDRAGTTQVRLRASMPHDAPDNNLTVRGGADAKLFVEYTRA